jgi:hypothetical protein
MPEEERAATLEQIRGIVSSGETPSALPIHVVIGLASAVGR